jgi:hypothetical protein
VNSSVMVELLAIGAMIEHAIVGPHLVRVERCGRGRAAATPFFGRLRGTCSLPPAIVDAPEPGLML